MARNKQSRSNQFLLLLGVRRECLRTNSTACFPSKKSGLFFKVSSLGTTRIIRLGNSHAGGCWKAKKAWRREAPKLPHHEADKAANRVPGRRRRLFQLLQEPQEPFRLDVYLVEKGHSGSLVAQSNSTCPAVCWPGKACERVLKKLKSWRTAPPRDIFRPCVDSSELGNSRGGSERELNANFLCDFLAIPASIHDGEDDQYNMSAAVGLIDFPHKVVDMFSELLEIAYTPAFYELIGGSMSQLDQPDKIIPGELVPDQKMSTPWEHQLQHLASLKQVTFSDTSSSGSQWHGFRHQATEVGTEIETKIFEDIKEELILDIIMYI